ncbi:helix-turn-helix transcriptional regulator [Virgibacillus sp. C22-A2]|uniref:Helix-turn-helix transcriptional regulator n=1 Tax=Virgibacillus tibetensis TaxID=3042313 RepID=A0ABU6KFR5_9BACI|nr:helix-turn-helix transcriptional regulator [Virgibacillus sp. C22-A2]
MIGENIKKLREKRGLTLSECAVRAEISKSYLSNLERDITQNPSILIIEKISAVLNVDLQTLLGSKSGPNTLPEGEWLDFVRELKESGVETEQLQEYKTVIEFAKWQKEKNELG